LRRRKKRAAWRARNLDYLRGRRIRQQILELLPSCKGDLVRVRVNATYKKHLRAVPRELLAMEQQHLRPLPVWVPVVYSLHERMVDVEGYVAVNTNRYSVPVDWIGRRVEVRETSNKVEIQLDPRHLVTHQRVAEAEHQHILLAEHRLPWGVRRPDHHPKKH